MTRTNREREALRYACDYLSIISLHVPIFLLLKGVVMFSDYFGGTRAALLQEKNAGDYTRRITHFAAPDYDSRASGSGLGRERGLADARRRTSDMADDAIAAP